MSITKKFGLIATFIVFMYAGGIATQSSITMYQGFGAFMVMVALASLFIFLKLIRTSFNALTGFIFFGSIMLYIVFCLGLFKNGNNVGNQPMPNTETATESENVQQSNSEDTSAGVVETEEEEREEEEGFFFKLFSSKKKNSELGFNPEDYPAVEGYAEAVTGAMLGIEGLHVKLFGVEAPYMQQTCTSKFGQSYNCGQVSRNWLQDWLQGKIVRCHIISPEKKGRATGVCFSQGYDVGAVIVNAGWAVAYTKNTDIYVPYEQQAGTKKRGLWAGTFYKPWDWKKLQSRESKVTIETVGDSVGKSVEKSVNSILGAF